MEAQVFLMLTNNFDSKVAFDLILDFLGSIAVEKQRFSLCLISDQKPFVRYVGYSE